MADDDDPKAGELTTANYGWTKPNVMGSDDAWGGYLNADLDDIDSVVHGIDTRPPYVLPTASTTVLGGVKVDGSTISINGGVISGTAPVGPPVTISDTPPVGAQLGALWWDSVGGQLYTFYNDGNSSQWVIAVNAAASLLPASTTVLGGVKVDGTTIKAAADGTISTTVVPLGDNRIINGDMRIDQRNGGAVGTATSIYTVDRWLYQGTQNNGFYWGQNIGPPATFAPGFPYCLGFSTQNPYAPTPTDFFKLLQFIEADMIGDFAWGTANAQPVTLSFWAMTTVAGTYSGAIINAAGTRSYPFSFVLPANVWTKFVIAIPGDTTGSWPMSGNGASLSINFDLGSGANFHGPANIWQNGTITAATGARGLITAIGVLYVTGVKLEIGSVATPYNRQSLAKSMADCQRYYLALIQMFVAGYAGYAGAPAYTTVTFPASMRATPTIAFSSQTYSNASALAGAGVGANTNVTLQVTATTAGMAWGQSTATFNAEL